ncbi:MAG: TIGR00725 family protein [candidate division Zixibacteria bacterium]|nr:TIGR00725 family protein [candidate division Zixibacteria bacterium]
MNQDIYIGILGAHSCDESIAEIAETTGSLIANSSAILVCGGKGGVMEAACRGSRDAGGTTIGILPGNDPEEGNPYLTYRILTGLGEGRNMIIIRSVDAAIAISGSYGTLSEIALCLRAGVPVVSLKSWDIPGMELITDSPEKAVELVIKKAKEKNE